MPESADSTYGARFLQELRARLRSTAGLRYAAVRALEKADREEFGRILRAELTGLSYAANQVIEREEPEVAAKWFAAELEKQDGSSAAAVFFLVS